MASGGTIFDYGIAVNFFGNYARESKQIQNSTDLLSTSLMRIKQAVIGASVGALFYRTGSMIMNTARQMEQNFATLTSTLGSTTKALETLEWARKKGAETPFEINEVNDAVALMTSLGFNRNNQMREDVFKSIGDFAGLKGFGFADMMQRVAKAGFGNWESLGDQFGIRRQTIGGMVREQMSRTPDKFRGEEADIAKYIQTVEKGTAGTEEYRMAIVKLIGVLGRDGMMQRINTIGGALGNINDVFQNFMINMVGYSQVQGTLANTIKNTIVDNLLNPLSEAHVNNHSALKETTTTVDQLGRIGKGVGEILITVWSGVSDAIGSGVLTIRDYVDRLDVFFSDFKNNIAPIILFIALIRLEVEDFLKGFWDGFSMVFGFFLKTIYEVYTSLANFVKWLGITESSAQALGLILGTVLGLLWGIRVYKIATAPLQPLYEGASMVLVQLDKIIFKQRIMNGMNRMMAGNFASGWTLMAGGVSRTATALSRAAIASWSFTASLMLNPITWIVLAVIALVGWIVYLVAYWDEWQAKMQGVADWVILLTALFLPIVGIPMLLGKYWDDFKQIFINIWETIKNYSLGLWIYFKAYVVEPIKKGFTDLWEGIKSVAKAVWDWISDKVSGVFNYLLETFPALNIFVTAFKMLWNDIKGIFSSIWGMVEKIFNKFTDSNFIKNILEFFKGWSSGARGNSEDFLTGALINTGQIEEAKKVQDEKRKRLYEPPTGDTTSQGGETVTKEADTKYDFNNATFNVTGVQNPNAFMDEIKKQANK